MAGIERSNRMILAVMAMLVLLLAACAGAEDEPAGDDPVDDPAEGAAATTIAVELDSYEIIMPDTVPPGVLRFEITNIADEEHGFEIVGPDLEARLPGLLQPGDTTYLDVQLQAGELYVVYCPEDDHDDMGMQMNITVQEPAQEP